MGIVSSRWTIPQPHPSAARPSAVEDADADYHRLVNSVERHTRCSSAYCLRQKNVSVPAECRFSFPKGLEEETHFNYELLPHHKIGAELVTTRRPLGVNSGFFIRGHGTQCRPLKIGT